METIGKILESIGLKGKEIEVYLAIIKLGSGSIVQIAKTTGIKRTTVYHCIEDLMEKGFVTKFIKDDKKIYIAEDPKVSLDNYLRDKENAIKAAVPELKNIFGIGSIQPEIKIYRNISGIRKILEDLLECKEKISRYYLSEALLEELMGEEFVGQFVRKRIKAGITSLSLRAFEKYHPQWEKNETHAHQLRKVKFLPEKYFVKPYITIYDNKVVVISAEEKIGFIIESKEFAKAQKAIFDMIWNSVAI
jgi:HTH-type transcriptional regulator, sugar sensing transcriptional regulator